MNNVNDPRTAERLTEETLKNILELMISRRLETIDSDQNRESEERRCWCCGRLESDLSPFVKAGYPGDVDSSGALLVTVCISPFLQNRELIDLWDHTFKVSYDGDKEYREDKRKFIKKYGPKKFKEVFAYNEIYSFPSCVEDVLLCMDCVILDEHAFYKAREKTKDMDAVKDEQSYQMVCDYIDSLIVQDLISEFLGSRLKRYAAYVLKHRLMAKEDVEDLPSVKSLEELIAETRSEYPF